MGGKLLPFVLGAAAGAIGGLLLAPRSGEQTRAMVADKVNDVWGEAQEWGNQASANVQEVYKKATVKGQEIVDDVKPTFAESNDELRKKIDAARQRIAEQVAKNASDAKQSVADAVSTAATDAKDAASPAH